MRSSRHNTIGARVRRGFTLVELVTAASLMTVVMLGVVEVFGIVTDAAAQAEAQNFANQQLRSFFDNLNRDVHGMTRQGFLCIVPRAVDGTGATWLLPTQVPDPSTGYVPVDKYSFYTLSFASLGRWKNTWGTPAANCGYDAPAAEVVYTNCVVTSGSLGGILNIGGRTVDVRRGVLARGVWLMENQGGTGGSSSQDHDSSSARYLTNMYVDASPRRITPNAPDPTVWVWPTLRSNSYVSAKDTSLSRVMSTCVSEFLVEYWDTTTKTWKKDQRNAYDTASRSLWPPAIRVTAAVHDPDVLGNLPPGQNRYDGFAMQEVYWIGDP